MSLLTKLIESTSNFYLSKKPFWILYKPKFHKVKGYEIREILNNIQVGDILLRRFDGYLNTFLTPGFWSHAAIYSSKNKIVHAVAQGVVEEDILDFCRTDSICVLRIIGEYNLNEVLNYIENSIKVNTPYDYYFKDDNGMVYCTEFVNLCFNRIFDNDYKQVLDRKVLLPDNIESSKKVKNIISFLH